MGFGKERLLIEKNTSVAKIAAEAAYYCLKIRFINKNKDAIPPFKVQELLEHYKENDEDSLETK